MLVTFQHTNIVLIPYRSGYRFRHSNEIYEQACARINRPGQKRNTTIVHLYGTAIEHQMFSRLLQKQSMQGLLFSYIEGDSK